MENEVQPNIPSVQPLPQTPAPVPQPTNWLRIFLFILLGLIIIAGSIFVGIQIGRNQITNQQPITTQPTITPSQAVVNPTVLPTTSITATPTIDSTAGWKAFKANDYEIKYPLDKYSLINGSSNINALWPGVVIINPNDSFSGYAIEISVFNNTTNLSVENPKDLFDSGFVNSMCSASLSNGKIDTIYLDQKKAFEMSHCLGGQAGTKEEIVTVENNKLYKISVTPLDQGSSANEVLNQILSTFKFTN